MDYFNLFGYESEREMRSIHTAEVVTHNTICK